MDGIPWRGPGPDRPSEIALPPDRLRPACRGRLRKEWRYVGVFGADLIVICARVAVGPIGQTFWAVLDRSDGSLLERTRMLAPGARGEVFSEIPGAGSYRLGATASNLTTRIEAGDLSARFGFDRSDGWVEAVCPSGEPPSRGGYTWTRKRAGIPIRCELRIGSRRLDFEGLGIEDESAGYHPRHTVWSWSAGVGSAADGRALAWNLVSGVNDPEHNSERAIWVDGVAHEPAPVAFDPDLGAITFAAGNRLNFAIEAERARVENRLLIRYSYRQPFGSYSGSLDGIELAVGHGVMEHHDAYW